jgi:hypothetical protein
VNWLAIVVVCVLACSAPAKPRKPVNVSDDRAKPQHIDLVIGADKYPPTQRSLHARAIAAGTWWYVVAVPSKPDGTLEVWLTHRGSKRVTFAVVGDRVEVPAVAGRLTITEAANPPTEYLVKVTTSRDAIFELNARYSWRLPPEPPRLVEETRVDPPCDLNKPDFRNPSCCVARCDFRRLGCTSRIVGGGPRFAKISLGAKDHIPRYSMGRLLQVVGRQEISVSRVVVWQVDENESTIQILEPDRVDQSKLAESRVVLSPPEDCLRR